MKKLRLNPETLSVKPFEVEAAGRNTGTVLANDDITSPYDCSPVASCGYPYTCGGTSCATGYPICRLCTTD